MVRCLLNPRSHFGFVEAFKAKLRCWLHGPGGRRIQDLKLPDDLPTGVHVVMLMTRRKHIEHADSWLGVRTAWERLLMERSLALKGEMQMYICCLLPWFWPLRWMWRYRIRHWASLLLEEEHTQVHIISTASWSRDFFQRMHIHDDGRAYTMVVRHDGEILWEQASVVSFPRQMKRREKRLQGGGQTKLRSYLQVEVLTQSKISVTDEPPAVEHPASEPVAKQYLLRARQCPHDRARMQQDFLDFIADKGLQLYAKQEEAIYAVFGNSHLVLSTPTGSGKSLVASAMLFRSIAEGKRAYYTCPVKALVSEKFFSLCHDFGPELIGMATGEVSINSAAPVICCTAEVLANVALRDGRAAELSYAVMDEFHFFDDKGRGYAWEVPLFRLPQVTFLLMSATMGDNHALYANLTAYTGRNVQTITSTDRPVPLDWSYLFETAKDAIDDLVASGRTPVYAVCFTQQDAATLAQSLVCKELAPSEQRKEKLAEQFKHMEFDTPYGDRLRQLLINGIGLHHAGLLPKYRRLVEQMAQAGLLTCICGTDTLGVGVNVPIRSVLFTQLCKYDGEATVLVTPRQFHQIAGRAGRRGYDTKGSVVAVHPAHEVYNKKLQEQIKVAENKKERERLKRRRRSAKNNFVDWDEDTFTKLRTSSPAPLRSRFQLSQGHVLSLLQGAQEHGRDGLAEVHELISLSLCGKKNKEHLAQQVDQYVQALSGAGLIVRQGDALRADSALQRDFLLMEDVSLFLVDVLPLLQWGFAGDNWKLAKAVLSVVEAICEARAKQRKQPRLPCEDVLWPAFENFLKRHPWVSRDALKPKAIALEMFEAQMSFSDFIKKLSPLDKSKRVLQQEGLLLRFLSQVHKTMKHNVPDDFKTDEVLEIEAFLLAAINGTDSSLLREWEALKELESVNFEDEAGVEALASAEQSLTAASASRAFAGNAPETESEFRFLQARARVEAQRFARHLARGRWKEASKSLRQDVDNVWDADSLREHIIAEGRRPFAKDSYSIQIEMDTLEHGLQVFGEILDEESRAALPWLEFEVSAPWPSNSFEALFQLQSLD
ncbi:helY [Symbiodinium microadriaticum]|nr:helY [Symbiodinium microadriaticum]